jgi:hypothetical protein
MTTPLWRPVGSIRGPEGRQGPSWEVLPFSMQGTLRVLTGAGRYPIKGGSYRLETVAATVEVPPLGSPVVVDVRVNGLSIYAGHPERRPTIAPGQHNAVVGAHNPTIVLDGGYVNVDIIAVGATLPGQFLVVAARLQQIVAADETLAP